MKIDQAIKQSKFESAHQKAFINIMYTANWLRDQQEDLFKEQDILPQHYNILRILKGSHPQPVSPGQIKEVMLDKGTDLTRIIDKLVKKDLVKRHVCEVNRRKVDVHITKEGLKFLNELNDPIRKLSSHIKKNISDKEAEKLSDLLDELRGK